MIDIRFSLKMTDETGRSASSICMSSCKIHKVSLQRVFFPRWEVASWRPWPCRLLISPRLGPHQNRVFVMPPVADRGYVAANLPLLALGQSRPESATLSSCVCHLGQRRLLRDPRSAYHKRKVRVRPPHASQDRHDPHGPACVYHCAHCHPLLSVTDYCR